MGGATRFGTQQLCPFLPHLQKNRRPTLLGKVMLLHQAPMASTTHLRCF